MNRVVGILLWVTLSTAIAAQTRPLCSDLRINERERSAARDTGICIDAAPGSTKGAAAAPTQPSEPTQGAEVERESTVATTVAVSVPQVWVPSFSGKDVAEARKALHGLDLRAETRPAKSSERTNQVIGQAPSATKVPRGSAIVFWVSDGSMVRVPSLVKLEVAAANALLRDSGLGAIPDERATSDFRRGIVMAQAPRAREEVERGSAVRITIAVSDRSPSHG